LRINDQRTSWSVLDRFTSNRCNFAYAFNMLSMYLRRQHG